MSAIAKQFSGLTAKDVVTWHRPIASGVIFGSLLSIWAIFVLAHYSITTFTARIASIVFIAGAAAAVTKQTFIRSPEDASASMDRAYESVRPHVTKSVDTIVALITWRDYTASAKAFIATVVAAFLGNWMSDTTLMLVVLIIAFTAPVAYEKKQKEIDHAIDQARAQVDKYLRKIKTRTETKANAVDQQLDEMSRKNQ